jgi:hypothetical protein
MLMYLDYLRDVSYQNKQLIVRYAFQQHIPQDAKLGQTVISDDELFTIIRNLLENKNGDLDRLMDQMDNNYGNQKKDMNKKSPLTIDTQTEDKKEAYN